MRFNIAIAVERKGKKVNDLAKEIQKNLVKFDFSRSQDNLDGRFDDWKVFYYATPEDFEGKVLGGEWPRVHAFVTPELNWIEGYRHNIESATMNGEESAYYAWKDQIVSLLEEYKDCAIFIAECHF